MKKGIKSHMQLPKLILKNFRGEADPEKKVWHMDLNTGKIRRSSPARLGTEIGYYSQEGEEFWNRYVETSLGKLVKKTKAFCDGEMDALIIDQDDAEAAKLYIKSAFIRSRATYEAVLRNSYTAFMLTDKQQHDIISYIGMNVEGPMDEYINNLVVTVLVNKTERDLVVPRNCYYCISSWELMHFVAPISPRCALMLLPAEIIKNRERALVTLDNIEDADEMNIMALKFEYMCNRDFIAAGKKDELEWLQNYRKENLEKLITLREFI